MASEADAASSPKRKNYEKPCTLNLPPLFFSYWDAVYADDTDKIIDLNFNRLCSAIVCNVLSHKLPENWKSSQALNIFFDVPPYLYSAREKEDGQAYYTLTSKHLKNRKNAIKSLNISFKRFNLKCIQLRTTVKKSRQNHRIKLTFLKQTQTEA